MATTTHAVPAAQLPYTQLQVPPEPKEVCPTLQKILKVVLIFFTMTALFTWGGFLVGLSTIPISIETGLISGGLIGTLFGAFLSWKIPLTTKTIEYRLEILGMLEPHLQSSERCIIAFNRLKPTLSKPLNFRQTYENHALHNEISVITNSVQWARPDIKKVWEAFLTHLDGTKSINADGNEITLDFSMELARLNRQFPIPFQVVSIDPNTPTYDEDLIQIRKLQEVCFGEGYIFDEELLKTKLAESRKNCCFVVRAQDPGNPKIYAFAWAYETDEGLNLAGIARDPGATHSGLGKYLIEAIQNRVSSGEKITLQVRASNPAIHLYDGCGFKTVEQRLENHYKNPVEDLFVLSYTKP